MNCRCHALLAPLFAILALLLALTGTASAAFNQAAQNPNYGEFLLQQSEVSGFESLQLADPTKENGEWVYDGALGVPAYVRQNPWTSFDPLGLEIKVETKNRDDGGKHTTIDYTAVLRDNGDNKGSRSIETLNKLRDEIIAEHIEHYTIKEGEHTVSITMRLDVVISAKDVKELNEKATKAGNGSPHVISITPESKMPLSKLGKPVEGVVDKNGGRVQYLNEATIGWTGDNYPAGKETIENTSAHETGHQLGLKHPPDNSKTAKTGLGFDNTNNDNNVKTGNIMSYYPGRHGIVPSQADTMQRKYSSGELNKPYTSSPLRK